MVFAFELSEAATMLLNCQNAKVNLCAICVCACLGYPKMHFKSTQALFHMAIKLNWTTHFYWTKKVYYGQRYFLEKTTLGLQKCNYEQIGNNINFIVICLVTFLTIQYRILAEWKKCKYSTGRRQRFRSDEIKIVATITTRRLTLEDAELGTRIPST